MDVIIVLLLLAVILYLAQLVVYLCASIGIFWVIIKEGYAVAIMRNNKFHKMLLCYTGHRFAETITDEATDNLEMYDIVQDEDPEIISSTSSRIINILFPVRGITWVGIPPYYSVHHYLFKWLDDRFEAREEEVSWILVKKYVYGLTLGEIELEGGLPYKIRLLITLQVTNPAKALFRVHRWLDASLERISGWARAEFSNLSADDFFAPSSGTEGAPPGTHASEKLKEALGRIMKLAEEQLTTSFGVSVDILQINEVDPSNEHLREIIIQKEVAKQKALAIIEEAHGEAEAICIVNAAAEKMGSNAMLLKGYHAVEHAGANVTLVGKDLNLQLMLQIPTNAKEGGAT